MRFRKYSILIVISVASLCSEVSAQEFSQLSIPLLLRTESGQHIDMVNIGGNPAWLFQRQRSMPLKVQLTQQSSSGDYRRPFDPGNSTIYQYYVEGQKDISANHVVQGAFGVVQEFRANWMWSDTKAYDSGNPIVIADSSTGLTDYRGLVLNGTYSGILADQWLIGASLKYGVDNGVKRISPKPLTQERTISITLGTAFLLTKEFSLGATIVMKNDKEENDFDADQTTAQSQTILYKFRGYDTYQKFTKNSENRIVRSESYGGYVQGSYVDDALTTIVSTGYRMRFANIVDGGSSPVQQGYWQSEIAEGTWAGQYLFNDVTVLSNAGLSVDRQWTQHPDFTVLTTEQDITTSNAGMLILVPVLGKYLFGGYSIAFRERNLTDYIGALSAHISSYTHTIMVGGTVAINDKNELRVWYALDAVDPKMDRVTVSNPSALYSFIGAKNFAYETASVVGSTVGMDISFDGGSFGHCSFSGLYRYREVQSSVLFDATSRSTFEVSFSTEL